MDFILPIGVGLVVATTVLHYEALSVASRHVGTARLHPRVAVLLLVLLLMLVHVMEMAVYAAAFYAERKAFPLSTLAGGVASSFWTYLYFSVETYTSLGFGDLLPQGNLRFLAGLETLNGLLMLGWSTSFIFLAMQTLWQLNGAPPRAATPSFPRALPAGRGRLVPAPRRAAKADPAHSRTPRR